MFFLFASIFIMSFFLWEQLTNSLTRVVLHGVVQHEIILFSKKIDFKNNNFVIK
jgi:hypothetical protein